MKISAKIISLILISLVALTAITIVGYQAISKKVKC